MREQSRVAWMDYSNTLNIHVKYFLFLSTYHDRHISDRGTRRGVITTTELTKRRRRRGEGDGMEEVRPSEGFFANRKRLHPMWSLRQGENWMIGLIIRVDSPKWTLKRQRERKISFDLKCCLVRLSFCVHFEWRGYWEDEICWDWKKNDFTTWEEDKTNWRIGRAKDYFYSDFKVIL